ncbi:MAG: Arm DNA-binding domain-containing protein [Acidithiobacillus sp.]
MPEKMQFTKARIAALEPVPGKRVTVYDEAQKGLCIRVTPAGAKTFYCVRKIGGRVEWLRIGDAAAVTIETARTTQRPKSSMTLLQGRIPQPG